MRLLILSALLSMVLHILSMEEIDLKTQNVDKINFKETLIDFPSLKLLVAWQIALENRTINKEEVPVEVLDYITGIKDIQAFNDLFPEEKKFFLNLLNDPEIDIEKHFAKLITKYLSERINQKFIDKPHFLRYMLFTILTINTCNDRNFISCRYIDIVRILLDTYIDLNAIFIDRYTPLTLAARRGREEIVKMLLDKGADPNMINGYEETPLICAVQSDNSKTVKMLLNAGATIDAQDWLGKTALMHDVSQRPNGDFDTYPIVETLLNHGANVNMQDRKGNTALMICLEHGNKKIAQILIAHGANVNIQNKEGCTALMNAATHLAVTSGLLDTQREEIVKILLDAGANVRATDNYSRTALLLAKRSGHQKTIDVLKEAEAGRLI